MAPYNRRKCTCGSGEDKFSLHDGHGIFLAYACSACQRKKLAGFRPDIMDHYECDEPIEAEY